MLKLKFGDFVCKHKKIILIIALLLLVPSFVGIKATRINYDILVYLPDDIETIKGEKILSEDFGMGSFSMIVLENMKPKDIEKLETKIREIDNVEKVIGISDVIGTSIPVDMIPDDIKDKVYRDGDTIILATFKEGISSDKTIKTIEKLRDITNEQCKIGGMSATVVDTRNLSNSEVAIYVIIAVILCIIILQIALDSYLAPLFLLLNIGFAIIYNMGTNIFLGESIYDTDILGTILMMSYMIYNVLNPIKIHTNTDNQKSEIPRKLSHYSMAEFSYTEEEKKMN